MRLSQCHILTLALKFADDGVQESVLRCDVSPPYWHNAPSVQLVDLEVPVYSSFRNEK